MKKFALVAVMSVGLVWSAVAGPVPKAWRARYDQIERLFAKKDMKGLDELCAPELTWVQVDGTTKNRKETFQEFAGMFTAQSIRVKEKLLGVKTSNGKAEVKCEVFFVIRIAGKSDLRVHSFCTDSWKQVSGKWLMTKTVDTKVEASGGN